MADDTMLTVAWPHAIVESSTWRVQAFMSYQDRPGLQHQVTLEVHYISL